MLRKALLALALLVSCLSLLVGVQHYRKQVKEEDGKIQAGYRTVGLDVKSIYESDNRFVHVSGFITFIGETGEPFSNGWPSKTMVVNIAQTRGEAEKRKLIVSARRTLITSRERKSEAEISLDNLREGQWVDLYGTRYDRVGDANSLAEQWVFLSLHYVKIENHFHKICGLCS
jgi:hypothetical protein